MLIRFCVSFQMFSVCIQTYVLFFYLNSWFVPWLALWFHRLPRSACCTDNILDLQTCQPAPGPLHSGPLHSLHYLLEPLTSPRLSSLRAQFMSLPQRGLCDTHQVTIPQPMSLSPLVLLSASITVWNQPCLFKCLPAVLLFSYSGMSDSLWPHGL